MGIIKRKFIVPFDEPVIYSAVKGKNSCSFTVLEVNIKNNDEF